MSSLPHALGAQVEVASLQELNQALAKSDSQIKMKPGEYNLGDLSRRSRKLKFSGSGNTIDLTGVNVTVTVGDVRESYIVVTGNDNTIIGGEFEDVYRNGSKKIKDFSAYNRDKRRLAAGLGGDAVFSVLGAGNTIDGLKLTVRGSFPYGYGSMFGIGADHTFGLNKRCGILIKGPRNTVKNAELQMRSFGHGIYMQGDADKTLIKDCLVEGRLRKTAEVYKETNPEDLPKRAGYKIPRENNRPIPKDAVHSLCEDGIRMYDIPGSVTVENCTVKKMRGGIRLYLGGRATVKNCKALFCEYTNFNLPSRGVVQKSTGDFSFGPLSDYRSSRNDTKVEWTIVPSPHAMGGHNILDVQGNNHEIVLNRSEGPIDRNEKRAIVVHGSGSTIINNTEYKIVLMDHAKKNKITSYGPVKGNVKSNRITRLKTIQ